MHYLLKKRINYPATSSFHSRMFHGELAIQNINESGDEEYDNLSISNFNPNSVIMPNMQLCVTEDLLSQIRSFFQVKYKKLKFDSIVNVEYSKHDHDSVEKYLGPIYNIKSNENIYSRLKRWSSKANLTPYFLIPGDKPQNYHKSDPGTEIFRCLDSSSEELEYIFKTGYLNSHFIVNAYYYIIHQSIYDILDPYLDRDYFHVSPLIP